MKIRTSLALMILPVLLIACGGFHLRGTDTLPQSISPVLISGLNEYSDLYRQLQYQLRASDMEVTTSLADAASVLKLTNVQSRNNLVAIDTRGKGVEYLLIERATIELLDNKRATLVSERKVAIDHYRYALGVEQLATEREREEKLREMQQEMAKTIIRSLHHALRSS